MKKVLLGLCALSAAIAGASIKDSLIAFSTKGPDCYRDGTRVLDGECYALVWSADGVFEGVAADGSPVDPKDAVVLTAPVAQGGRCPEVVFEIDDRKAAAYAGGEFAVYLLDTRVTANGRTTVGRLDAAGAAKTVNGAGPVAAGATAVASAGSLASVQAAQGAVTADAPAPRDVPQPRVEALRIAGGNAYITISGFAGPVRVQGAEGLNAGFVASGVDETPRADADGTAILVRPVNAKGSGFFKVLGVR